MFTSARRTFFGLCALAAGCIAAAQVLGDRQVDPALLQAALEQQCLTQDWPEHQHQAHVDYCASLSLPVGK